MSSSDNHWDFRVFYDAECPLCAREIQLIRRLDRKNGRVDLIDLHQTSTPLSSDSNKLPSKRESTASFRAAKSSKEWMCSSIYIERSDSVGSRRRLAGPDSERSST
jgi:predicted DCC family thiol-disulfide oxidoreductase YuxK